MYHKLLFIIILFFSLTKLIAQADSASISHERVIGISHKSPYADRINMDSLMSFASQYLGVRYGYGSTNKRSFDCSGFVMHVYGHFGVSLPHGSGAQAQVCKEIKLKEVVPGDLLFFSGRKVSRSRIGHVSLVKEVDGDRIVMIHATVQSGVIQEELSKSDYFTKRFIKAGRIKEFATN